MLPLNRLPNYGLAVSDFDTKDFAVVHETGSGRAGGLIVEGLRLGLRRPEASDLPFLSALFSDPLVMRFSDHGPRPPSFAREWLQKANESGGPSSRWISTLKEDDSPVGIVFLDPAPAWLDEDGLQLGFRLTPSRWSNGYGSEAAELAITAARGNSLCRRLFATVDPANVASLKILQKLGMTFEREVMGPGYDHPDYVYAMELT